MSASRRQFIGRTGVILGSGVLSLRLFAATSEDRLLESTEQLPGDCPSRSSEDYLPVITPNGATLPFKIRNGAKVFHLIAQPVSHEFAPGLVAECWGYNGSVHGPTIEAVEGDHVRIYVTNRLDVSTTVHWHGIRLPSGMDGVGGVSQRPIEPGETFRYEFTLTQHGTFMYHSHHDEMTQMAMGLMGMIVVHPRRPTEPRPNRDYVYMLSEWKITPGTRRPDPNEMSDFNVLTFNGKAFPGTAPMVARTGQRVRIRFGNLSAMDHHPIHLHGFSFEVTETDGGVIPPAGRWPETTVLVPVGSTRTVEFVADTPGDWAMHCHMTHHTMTQMGHGIPITAGVDLAVFDESIAQVMPDHLEAAQVSSDAPDTMGGDIPKNSIPMLGSPGPHGYISMGGMVTLLKVRDGLGDDRDPGWYENPPGTLADAATEDDLKADEITP